MESTEVFSSEGKSAKLLEGKHYNVKESLKILQTIDPSKRRPAVRCSAVTLLLQLPYALPPPIPHSPTENGTINRRQAACARVRALYPTRPSPIVVRHLLKSAQQRGSGSSNNADESKVPPRPAKASESAETAIAMGQQGRSGQREDGEGKRTKRPKTRDEGAKEGEARSLLPSWLFVHLPFHDEESFAEFFCEALRGSARLAAGFV